jgi:hypothetical protein
MRNLFVALIAVTTAAVAIAAQNPQKPGKWQVKMEMEMPGMPMKMPPITTEICLTEADIADPQKSVPKDPKSDCTVSDHKIKDNTVSWKMACPKQNMTGSGEITYEGDTYTGAVKMKMGDREMSTKYTGKWIGTCTK